MLEFIVYMGMVLSMALTIVLIVAGGLLGIKEIIEQEDRNRG
jgi:hypothetical protein